MPNRLVIDTSVAVKWFLKDPIEDDTDLADDILVALLADDLELHAPRIFTYEVSGVVLFPQLILIKLIFYQFADSLYGLFGIVTIGIDNQIASLCRSKHHDTHNRFSVDPRFVAFKLNFRCKL